MVSFYLEGIEIEFPYEPYDCQLKYMRSVLKCLNLGWNGILESPTGTGKTLCLLCACLAWQQHRKVEYSQAVVSGEEVGDIFNIPKIIYTSRTHSQLSQVIKELNKTVYRSVQVCLLGSRDQLCINDRVQNEKNNVIKNHMCRSQVKARQCHFYNQFEKNKGAFKSHYSNGKALDIEDLVSIGKKTSICPFYKSRDSFESAELLLLPYNYILDPRTRKANKVELKGNILIFDEAHNLEKVCEESASVSFSSRDLSACIREAQHVLNLVLKDQDDIRTTMGDSTAAFGSKEAKLEKESMPELEIEPNDLANLTKRLQKLEEVFDGLNLEETHSEEIQLSMKLPGKTFPGNFVKYLLNNAEIDYNHTDAINTLADKIATYLTVKNALISGGGHASWQNRGEALQRLASFMVTLFPEEQVSRKNCWNKSASDDLHNKTQEFFVYVAKEEPIKKPGWSTVKEEGKNGGKVLNYWCFSAGMGMKLLAEKGVRSVLITSGTLSPISSFADEMKIPFKESLENSHVIQAHQVWIGILSNGPDKFPLNASYHNRNNMEYLHSLGNTILNVCRVVPQGILVFFASYSQLERCVDYWTSRETLARLKQMREVFVEPRNKQEFQTTMQEFDKAVTEKNGAILFAVCRGKVSEGIDFSDSHGRAVIVVGIPYPPLMDPRVCLKRHYVDKQKQSQGRRQSQSYGMDDWYSLEAVRAVNQAIGRVIRHKQDFGAILLADGRFCKWDKSRFPAWLRSLVVQYNQFGEMQKSLCSFFRNKGLSTTKQHPVASGSVPQQQGMQKMKLKVTAEQKKLYEEFHKQNQMSAQLSERSFINGIREAAVMSTQNGVDIIDSQSEQRRQKRPIKVGLESLESFEGTSVNGETVSQQWDCSPIAGPICESQTSPDLKRRRIRLKPNGAEANESTEKRSEGEKKLDYEPLRYLLMIRKELSKEAYAEFHKLARQYKEGLDIESLLNNLSRIWLPNHKTIFKDFRGFVRFEDKETFDKFCKENLA